MELKQSQSWQSYSLQRFWLIHIQADLTKTVDIGIEKKGHTTITVQSRVSQHRHRQE